MAGQNTVNNYAFLTEETSRVKADKITLAIGTHNFLVNGKGIKNFNFAWAQHAAGGTPTVTHKFYGTLVNDDTYPQLLTDLDITTNKYWFELPMAFPTEPTGSADSDSITVDNIVVAKILVVVTVEVDDLDNYSLMVGVQG